MPVEAPVTSTALPARSGIERDAAVSGMWCSSGGLLRQSYAPGGDGFK